MASATAKTSLLAALIGLIYTLASWQAGKFARRFGYFTALKIGFGLMAAGLAAGSQLHSASAPESSPPASTNIGMCFIWPTLEALVSEGDTPERVPHAVGIYNITWAATNAAAFFIGGTLIEKFGFKAFFICRSRSSSGNSAWCSGWKKSMHDLPPAPAET